MEKPNSLRAAITAMIPELARSPDRFELFVRTGSVRAVRGDNRDFVTAYTLTGIIVDYASHPALVWLAINDWLRVNQPDLLNVNGAPAYRFEADILSDKAVDLQFEVDLTENVSLAVRDDGGFDLLNPADPAPWLDDDVPLSDPPGLLKQIWWRDEKLLPDQ